MIIVHYQPNAEGAAALDAAIAEARLHGEGLSVVASGASDRHMTPSYLTDEQMAELHADLDAAGIEHDVHRALDDDDPANDVLHRAEQRDARLIVTGLRHRSRVGKFVTGSIVQHILLGATCPVLAVKPRMEVGG